MCSVEEISKITATIYKHYTIIDSPEITLEANPDDLTLAKIEAFSKTKINRLSIGVQSFFEKDLQWMNRAHNAHEAMQSIIWAKKYFDNISIDLIYGIPNMPLDRWKKNIEKVLQLGIPHVSCYALTVEANTALEKMIARGEVLATNDTQAAKHYQHLVTRLEAEGYINYEFSNFGKVNFFSGNNTSYWQGKPYLGIGPSAHSFDGQSRSWNISNNIKYLKEIEKQNLPSEKEILSTTDRYNEYIMTGLRTQWGVCKEKIISDFGNKYALSFEKEVYSFVNKGLIRKENTIFHLTKKGKFLGDGISSNLFFVD